MIKLCLKAFYIFKVKLNKKSRVQFMNYFILFNYSNSKLAYYSALKKDYDIDKRRNLAKSVTVE